MTTETRIEFGAKVCQTGTIYMHDFSAPVVDKFITEFSTVTPIKLVTRQWAGDSHGAWVECS